MTSQKLSGSSTAISSNTALACADKKRNQCAPSATNREKVTQLIVKPWKEKISNQT
jgi:hypothetical protein